MYIYDIELIILFYFRRRYDSTVQYTQAPLLFFPLFFFPQAIVYSQLDAPEGTGSRQHNASLGAIRAGVNDDDFSDDDG